MKKIFSKYFKCNIDFIIWIQLSKFFGHYIFGSIIIESDIIFYFIYAIRQKSTSKKRKIRLTDHPDQCTFCYDWQMVNTMLLKQLICNS